MQIECKDEQVALSNYEKEHGRKLPTYWLDLDYGALQKVDSDMIEDKLEIVEKPPQPTPSFDREYPICGEREPYWIRKDKTEFDMTENELEKVEKLPQPKPFKVDLTPPINTKPFKGDLTPPIMGIRGAPWLRKGKRGFDKTETNYLLTGTTTTTNTNLAPPPPKSGKGEPY